MSSWLNHLEVALDDDGNDDGIISQISDKFSEKNKCDSSSLMTKKDD